MKITVLGDIMCEPPILKASQKEDGSYDFSGLYAKVRPMLSEADYVIGNLEFPLGGDSTPYSDRFFVFNAPDSFAVATKEAGVDLVSTVNNHTLDRGLEGMKRTIKVLDEIGLPHTGSFLPEKGREEAYYFEVDGVKFALVAYTYTTNKDLPDGEKENFKYINCVRPYDIYTYLPDVRKKMNSWVDKLFKNLITEKRAVIRKWVGLPGTVARADDYINFDAIEPYIDQFVSDIKTAKEKADFVICYPHIGGQFNVEPGSFSKYVVDQAVRAGADAVLASHSHMVQRATFKKGIPVAYSLGNFSMTINSSIVVKEHLPDYGLAMHLYLDGKELKKVTFSILKAVEKKGKQMVSWPVDELYKELKSEKEKEKLIGHVRQVYKYATGKDITGDVIRKEYDVEA